ncbi:MAG: BLUF domain-containing protein [Brevundimonas sp.]|uniref:BLUF domain-containing protein n=1 Tax=Brevundimonas sp. TaxID=1871086 RepID=UPI00391A6310
MLHRLIYASEAIGATGATTLSIAQILGVSERNNRRDHLTSCIMFHDGHILQAIEGARVDIDRLIRRLLDDPRHSGVRILSDEPIKARRFNEPITLCGDPAALLDRVGVDSLSRVTANEIEALLEFRDAA